MSDELLERERTRNVERRAEWRAGYESGLVDGYRRVFQSAVLEQIAVELVFLRTALPKAIRQIERVNAGRIEALRRVVELARELDQLAPGWDTQ